MSTTNEVKASYWYPDELHDFNEISSFITHIFFVFLEIHPRNHHVFLSEEHEKILSTYSKTIKDANLDLKLLLSVGGKKVPGTVFASMASDSTSRKLFIDTFILIARQVGFDGLDIAWEYPEGDKQMNNFGILLQELRSAAEEEAEKTQKTPLLLTAAVYYSSDYDSVSYPVEAIKQSLDWVNIQAFDFHGSSTIIAPPAPLYVPSNRKAPCGHTGLNQWIKAGLPEKKAVFGFPSVGWQWSVEGDYDETATTRLSPILQFTTLQASSADGSITYDQIQSLLNDHKATTVYDPMVVGDYCSTDTNTRIGYDSIFSVVTKVRYANLRGLLGYFCSNLGANKDLALSRAASDAWDY